MQRTNEVSLQGWAIDSRCGLGASLMVYLDASSCTDKPYEGGEAWHLVSLVALAANMEGIADPIIGGPRSLRAVLHQAVVTV